MHSSFTVMLAMTPPVVTEFLVFGQQRRCRGQRPLPAAQDRPTSTDDQRHRKHAPTGPALPFNERRMYAVKLAPQLDRPRVFAATVDKKSRRV
jgi:hypothetical protein